MTDLIKALRAQVAFDEAAFYTHSARYENARLAPILDRLIAVVEAAEKLPTLQAKQFQNDSPLGMLDKALADLRAAVGMGAK